MKKQNKRFHILGRKEGRKEGRKAYNALTKSPLALFSCLIFLFAAFLFTACDSDDVVKVAQSLGWDPTAKSSVASGTRPTLDTFYDVQSSKGSTWKFEATYSDVNPQTNQTETFSFKAQVKFTGYDGVTGFIKAKITSEETDRSGATDTYETDAYYFPTGDNAGNFVIFNKDDQGNIDYSKTEITPCEFVKGNTDAEDLIVITDGEFTKVGGDNNTVIGDWTGAVNSFTYTYLYSWDDQNQEHISTKDNNNREYQVTITNTSSVTISSDGSFSYTEKVTDVTFSANDPADRHLPKENFMGDDVSLESKIVKNENGVLYAGEEGFSVPMPVFYYTYDGKLMRAMMALKRAQQP